MYVITGLAAGDYRVQFSAPIGSNLVGEYHPDTTNYSLAVPVKVAAGATVSGIDASLAVGASITGHVTDDQGQPVQGVNVSASSTAMTGDCPRSATTDADGVYVITGLAAGDYRVQFSATDGFELGERVSPGHDQLFVGGAGEGGGGCDRDGDRCVVGGWCFDHRTCHRRRGSPGAGRQRVGQLDRDARWQAPGRR